ncbi:MULTISPECIES: pyroglutamyl-peptidase I [Clostridium]|uniref:Pyrrolidone-carboxylate peptidase n=1 Tax=Clostridium senegalense TaxID=1465809 RepID=A0A6M0H7I3_9CLOT|nr:MULTISPECIES: pyroglutamyl-peptidase I [Clostridium]NEU06254.1 pyroglutamyl-peptidase I [Clostridium senegalense]
MKVLITGFDPFGGEKVNPALEAVKLLPDIISGAEVIKLEIPTVFRKSVIHIDEAIKMNNPDIVISVGQAGGRFGINPERVAINIDDARIKDNIGNQPIDIEIEEDGKKAYFSSLPIKAMVKKMNDNGIPAAVSNTAGTFVCNHVMYGILYLIDKKYPNIKGGFIHVPYIPNQVISKPNTPYMSLKDISKGLELCIEAAVENSEDLKITGGTIC